MGVAAIGGAICYGTLAARYPEPGGTYVYLREVYGHRMAFLYGWLSMLVTDPGLTAMLAVGLAVRGSSRSDVPVGSQGHRSRVDHCGWPLSTFSAFRWAPVSWARSPR